MYVNASLIRELRMMYQHAQSAFGGRTPVAPTQFARTQQTVTTPVKCCFCVDISKKPLTASTIIDGFAVCVNHSRFVKDEHYNAILSRIRRSS